MSDEMIIHSAEPDFPGLVYQMSSDSTIKAFKVYENEKSGEGAAWIPVEKILPGGKRHGDKITWRDNKCQIVFRMVELKGIWNIRKQPWYTEMQDNAYPQLTKDKVKDADKYYKQNCVGENNTSDYYHIFLHEGASAILASIVRLANRLDLTVEVKCNTVSGQGSGGSGAGIDLADKNGGAGSAGSRLVEESSVAKKPGLSALESRIANLIENGQYQIILTGAPGTGKTYTAKKIANMFTKKNNIEMVQFHPSYDYTDFVEGLRPIEVYSDEADAKTSISFRRVDGSFMRFCRKVVFQSKLKAEGEKEDLFFFIIDEINRADLSKVLGELMSRLESDKRGEGIKTQYANLDTYFSPTDMDYITGGQDGGLDGNPGDCFPDGFFIPKNVVIIGTMNDIDRSVESMDFAMRRRFVWEEVRVDEELLVSAFGSGNFGEFIKANAKELAGRICRFNLCLQEKKYGLSSDYDISQGQFSGISAKEFESVDALMKWVWDYRVKPLLKEYLRGSGVNADEELSEKPKGRLYKAWMNQPDTESTAGSEQADNAAPAAETANQPAAEE